MRKLLLRYLACLLIVNQKQKRVDDSERCFELTKLNKNEFFLGII